MHRVFIAQDILDRISARGPRARILNDFDPSRTAHVIVDLQNGFMAQGSPREVPFAREIVSNVNALSAALRRAGGVNAFLKMNLGTAMNATWRSYLDRLVDPHLRETVIGAFSPGSPFFELWDKLDVEPSDLSVEKTRFGVFVPGASPLHELLQARGIDTLIITGTLTNVCCESTARDAMQMDYRVLFVSDATAALSDEMHNATLANMMTSFADVVTTDEVLAALHRAAPE